MSPIKGASLASNPYKTRTDYKPTRHLHEPSTESVDLERDSRQNLSDAHSAADISVAAKSV